MRKAPKRTTELPSLHFAYSLLWDANNWVQSIRKMDDREIDWGIKTLRKIAPSLVGAIQKAVSNQEALNLTKRRLRASRKGTYPIQRDATEVVRKMQAEWKRFAPKFWPRLGKILAIPISDMHKKYSAHYTTAVRCPFDRKNWAFMYSRFWSFANTAAHEIMHMEYWDKYEAQIKKFGLTPMQQWNLQEALTVLLNEEMLDILPHPEQGYRGHEQLRKKIVQLWRQTNGNFKELLPKAAEATRRCFPRE